MTILFSNSPTINQIIIIISSNIFSNTTMWLETLINKSHYLMKSRFKCSISSAKTSLIRQIFQKNNIRFSTLCLVCQFKMYQHMLTCIECFLTIQVQNSITLRNKKRLQILTISFKFSTKNKLITRLRLCAFNAFATCADTAFHFLHLCMFLSTYPMRMLKSEKQHSPSF